MNHWIIVPVVLPAIAAAFMIITARHELSLQRIFSCSATVLLLGVALLLFWGANNQPPETYLVGNWPAPFGIVLVLDRLAALMVLLTAILAVIVQLYAMGSGWDTRGKYFHVFFQFQLMGITGAFMTGDAFNLFVFFEVLLIASYGLMVHGGGAMRMRAGVQYVAYNLIGSTLFLFGLAAIYSITGTLNMADLALKVMQLPAGDAALIRVSAVMLLAVFAIKGALVPLQFWLPATYSFAPGPVAALFAVMTKVGAYAVIRIFTLIFPPEAPAVGSLFGDILMPAALVTLAIGAIGILGASTLARLAAFASIASMGTVFLAISAFTPEATAAGLYYMLHSTFAAAMLFMVADLVLRHRGQDTLSEVLPKMSNHGLISVLFFASAIAAAGMPPLSGFLGKLMVLDALRGPHMALIWTVVLGSSLLMILGFARAGSTVFWKAYAAGDAQDHTDQGSHALAYVATFAMLALFIAMTLGAGVIMGWLEGVSLELFDRLAYIESVMAPQE